jgi:hypothetical protein
LDFIAQSIMRPAEIWEIRVQFLVDAQKFLLSTESRLSLGPSKSLIKWVSGAFSVGEKQEGREPNHSLLLSRLIMRADIPTLPIRLRGYKDFTD